MKDEDIRILESVPNPMLAEWWCLLNKFGWPEGLNNPEHVDHKSNPRRSQIMGWIMGNIGIKECLREWNRNAMPGAAVDEWWDKRDTPRGLVTPNA